ncbi:hypothetical protein J7E50_18050 [Pedobacter sp. ISL-68]|uniref:hypothetical protein n=1 Tax=unclassified Pedobacter TaxID=2628915 RepID=UPI001BEB3708|nr:MULTISPECIES: hypothetical protein [unclassified Pedobacter]MBT2559827.1 hypothetical protein [Pedobacter sp. ISL-64]MBT2592132.1 hypothetical protein [Pedobacter sp. ISL-68]
MRNIWFTIYSSTKDDTKFIGLQNYRTLLEMLLIPAIQDKISRDKKIQKYMLMFSNSIEDDNIELFKDLHYEKKVNDGIVNLYISTKHIEWNKLTEQEKKDFLIEKWKILFNNLSDDYFLTDKSEVIKSLEELREKDWKITSSPLKKKLKYNKEVYTIVMDISAEKTELALVRDSDGKRFALKDFETSKIQTDANFKNFKLDGDILTFVYSNIFNTMFESPAIFDLKELIQ